MKALKQKFHQQIVKKHKFNHFATIRKEVLQFQQFQTLYDTALNNDQDLNTLLEKVGYVVFFKHINKILNEKLYAKLYQNEQYFLLNLNFVSSLLSCQILPSQEVNMVINGLSQIIRNYKHKITALNIGQIFQIVEKILSAERYASESLEYFQKQGLIANLYRLIIEKQMDEYFFKIVRFSKIISNQQITQLTDKELVNCLQMHILTSNRVEQLYVSYSFLAEVFDRFYTKEQELFQYGSILDKTMKDIFVQRLIGPISFFFMKSLNNDSLLKLFGQMNFLQTIFEVIQKILFRKNNVSVFGHQSIWSIFRKIIQFLTKTNKFKNFLDLDWNSLKQKLENHSAIKFPYVKMQIFQCLKQLCRSQVKGIFIDLIPVYSGQYKEIQI